jgi:hypothetical protein
VVILYIIGAIVGLIILLWIVAPIYTYVKSPPLRPKEEGFKYVHIDYDGSVRELYPEEVEYLSQKFHGADGGRPYIKNSYEERTPDEKISGYILRRRVPKEIIIIKRDRNTTFPDSLAFVH